MNDQQFRQLLDHFGYSWGGYRKVRKGIKKRVCRHMQQIGCRTTDEYVRALDSDEELRRHCERLMTVSVSHFFRDRLLWKIIEAQILPAITRENRNTVKLWFAGCACGEEVYSFKISWERALTRADPMPRLEIWATDINPTYLRRAQEGRYAPSSLKQVPQVLRETYFIFHVEDGIYRIAPCLKRDIQWKVHNLLLDLGQKEFQIIFLRNSLLTYYKDELRVPAFLKVMANLARGGFLIIGRHEKVPIPSDELVPISSQRYIFKKIGE